MLIKLAIDGKRSRAEPWFQNERRWKNPTIHYPRQEYTFIDLGKLFVLPYMQIVNIVVPEGY